MQKLTLAAVAASLIVAGTTAAYAADPVVTGIINPDGTKQTNGAYTVSHPGTGHYVITLTNYAGAAICVVNVIGGPTYVRSAGFGSKTCDISFGNKKGAPTNVLFTFHSANP